YPASLLGRRQAGSTAITPTSTVAAGPAAYPPVTRLPSALAFVGFFLRPVEQRAGNLAYLCERPPAIVSRNRQPPTSKETLPCPALPGFAGCSPGSPVPSAKRRPDGGRPWRLSKTGPCSPSPPRRSLRSPSQATPARAVRCPSAPRPSIRADFR